MSPDRLSDLTIVVVEDHDDARRYLGLFLNQIGANVVLARNGFEGLEATKNTFKSNLGEERLENCHGAPAVESSRFRHKPAYAKVRFVQSPPS
jgi:CheY-like chemotaxis protein